MISRVHSFTTRLLRHETGNLTSEFALLAPMMLLLALATVDTVNYILVANKVTQVAAQTADAVARQDELADSVVGGGDDDDDDDGGGGGGQTGTSIDGYFFAANEMGKPLALEDAGRVIISSVANVDGTGPRIVWQRTGDYELDVESNLGVEGDIATLPDGFTLAPDQNAIFAEVFYEFSPLVFSGSLLGLPETVLLERTSTFRPRLAPLTMLQ